jgi:hypothetical protein
LTLQNTFAAMWSSSGRTCCCEQVFAGLLDGVMLLYWCGATTTEGVNLGTRNTFTFHFLRHCCCLQVFAGLLVGAMLSYWFSAMTMKSVGKAAPAWSNPAAYNNFSPFCCCLQVFAGLLVGAMLPYWSSAMTMKSVGKAALAMPHACSNLLVKLLSNLLLPAGVCWPAGRCHAALLVQRLDHAER